MKGIAQIGILLLAAGITIAAGIYHERITNRGETSQGMENASQLMNAMPQDIGPWHLDAPETLPAESLKILQCASHVSGKYTNQETGDTVMVTTLLGPPGPTSVHRPEICMSAIDFPIESERERIIVPSDGVDHSAWMVQFRNVKDASGGVIRVYYAWSNGEAWTAADEPRISYGREPFLFKVQIRSLEANTQQANDPARAFFSDFIPVFKKLTAQHLNGGSK